MINSKWISIYRESESNPCINSCLYHTRTGDIIFKITNGKTEVMDEYKIHEKYLLDMCLNWDENLSYDYDVYIRPLNRNETLKKLGI